MECPIPRVVLAGTNSGCGKTTITCAILQALQNRKKKVGAFKCGPDYIDPMFHKKIIGAKSANLDLFFFSENTLNYLLMKNGADREINIIEGVMGFYDGLSLNTTKASTYEISQATQSPVILVVNARGASLSVLATLQGFLTFIPRHQVCGVILNQCTAKAYPLLAEEIKKRFSGKVLPLGFMPTLPECTLESRHLGLITAAEVKNLQEKLTALANQAEQTIDLDTLLILAKQAPSVSCVPIQFPRFRDKIRIAVAQDKAFCFYYEDNLDALVEMGAELVPFSPLVDQGLPSDIQGLYLGGGYPELYAQQLSENHTMLTSVKEALTKHIPCIAECGGFMYLTQQIASYPMVGYLPGKTFDTGKRSRFGYVRLKAKRDTLLCPAGQEIAGHEFHQWDSEQTGDCFIARKETGQQWPCVFATKHLYAGYPHFHFYANPFFGINFYSACLKEKYRHV